MNKDIKNLIEDIVNFNPVDYSDDELIDKNTLDNILQIPKNKNDLSDIIRKRINENKFGDRNLVFPDLSNIDTSYITDMSSLFADIINNRKIKLDLSKWNTSNVTNMSFMFNDCMGICELNLSGWDTSNVINMASMFTGCLSLTKLDLTSFDISNVTNISSMFDECKSLRQLILPEWDTSNVEIMHSVFGYCGLLNKLDISNWNVTNAHDMRYMFFRCDSLTNLDISEWNVSHLKSEQIQSMFYGCNSTIIPDWYYKIYYNKINESNMNFNVTDYEDDEQDIINRNEISKITYFPKALAEEMYNRAQRIFKKLDNILDEKLKPVCPPPFTVKKNWYNTIYHNKVDIYSDYRFILIPNIDFTTDDINFDSDERYMIYNGFESKNNKKQTIDVWTQFFESLKKVKNPKLTSMNIEFVLNEEEETYKETHTDPETNDFYTLEYGVDINGIDRLLYQFMVYIKNKYCNDIIYYEDDHQIRYIWFHFMSKSDIDLYNTGFTDIAEEKINLLLNIFNEYANFIDIHLLEYVKVQNRTPWTTI